MDRHHEKYRQLSYSISHYRKMRGLTQEQFAELVHISRGYLSHIEAPNVISSFSIAILFDIADTLDIETKLLLEFN